MTVGDAGEQEKENGLFWGGPGVFVSVTCVDVRIRDGVVRAVGGKCG